MLLEVQGRVLRPPVSSSRGTRRDGTTGERDGRETSVRLVDSPSFPSSGGDVLSFPLPWTGSTVLVEKREGGTKPLGDVWEILDETTVTEGYWKRLVGGGDKLRRRQDLVSESDTNTNPDQGLFPSLVQM